MLILDEARRTLTSSFWLDDPVFWQLPVLELDDGSIDDICTNIEKYLQHQQAGRAVNWLVLGFRVFPGEFPERIQRAGHLRPSRYQFRAGALARAVDIVLANAEALRLCESTLTYLTSIHCLVSLAPSFLRTLSGLQAFLATNRPLVLKGLLAAVDYLFLIGHSRDDRATSADLEFFTKEDIAEGLSYLIHLYVQRFGLADEDSELMDASGVAADAYHSPLAQACLVRSFMEWEILVDALGFTLKPGQDDREFILSCPDVRLAQSLRLGYIQTQMQMQIAAGSRTDTEDTVSIQTLGRDFYRHFGDIVVKRVEEPFARFTYSVPDVPEFMDALAGDALFEDEIVILASAARELFAPAERVLEFPIYKSAVVLDLIKVQRLASFLRVFAGVHLLEIASSDRPLVFQSLIPRFTTDVFVTILARIIPRGHAEDLVEFLSWQPDSGSVLDVQYQPLVCTGRTLTIPMNIFGMSNVIRNSLQLARERIHGQTGFDPLVPILVDALANHSWSTRPTTRYRFVQSSGEIDVIAWRGKYVFAFECKNSLHPCSVHEIRTSIDHLKKAADQLGRLVSLWRDGTCQQE